MYSYWEQGKGNSLPLPAVTVKAAPEKENDEDSPFIALLPVDPVLRCLLGDRASLTDDNAAGGKSDKTIMKLFPDSSLVQTGPNSQ